MEIWKTIENTNGFYEISNLGNVRSTPKAHVGRLYLGEYHMLTPYLGSRGYYVINYNDANGRHVVRNIHQLVAIAFIPNPDNLNCINHKDECKTNNCVDNLEWCTVEYNNAYGTRVERGVQTRLAMHIIPPNRKPIVQYDKQGNFIKEFDCIDNAVKELGLSTRSHISECCNHKRKTAHKFIWRFKEEVIDENGNVPNLIRVTK